MNRGRPRTAIGTYGAIRVADLGGRYRALTRFRDLDGRLRRVTATARSRRTAEALLKERLLDRAGYGSGGVISGSSPFGDLADLWLADLALRDISENTKENYRDDLRRHIRPRFERYTLGEITTGRVEWFLKSERAVSHSRAKHSRTVLNQLFSFALRNDAIPRNPVEGTSPLPKPKHQVRALTLEQVQAIRSAAATWRTGARVMGPKPDGQVRDAIEVLLGTSMRPGEVLALRPCDIVDGPRGMVAHVRGTVVYRQGKGTLRQDHPKTDASVRPVPVPDFAARVLRRRIAQTVRDGDADRTVFANRSGAPLSAHNFRRTFREFLRKVLTDRCTVAAYVIDTTTNSGRKYTTSRDVTPGWLNLLVLLFVWNAIKFAAFELVMPLTRLKHRGQRPGGRAGRGVGRGAQNRH